MRLPLQSHGFRKRSQEQEENPYPGSDGCVHTTLAQIRKQAIDSDRIKKAGQALENVCQRYFLILHEGYRLALQGGDT